MQKNAVEQPATAKADNNAATPADRPVGCFNDDWLMRLCCTGGSARKWKLRSRRILHSQRREPFVTVPPKRSVADRTPRETSLLAPPGVLYAVSSISIARATNPFIAAPFRRVICATGEKADSGQRTGPTVRSADTRKQADATATRRSRTGTGPACRPTDRWERSCNGDARTDVVLRSRVPSGITAMECSGKAACSSSRIRYSADINAVGGANRASSRRPVLNLGLDVFANAVAGTWAHEKRPARDSEALNSIALA